MAMHPVHVTDSAEPLLQSTAGINIIFVNIDWKKTRQDTQSAAKRNLKQLAHTIGSIVTEMKPAVICCCEVGNVMTPMTSQQINEMMQTFRHAWREDIAFLHDEGEPYLTAWDGNLCSCKHKRILRNLYKASNMPRTAQAFVCTMPGETDDLGIDVINVHAPSGDPRLTDQQRRTLFWNLLQSSSKVPEPKRLQESCLTKTIGEVKFIIGGDTNTSELTLALILNNLRKEGNLTVSFEVMRPTWGQHGGICIVGGCNKHNTKTATGKAENHDPQHIPYGIWWCSQSQHATEQLTPTSQVKAGSTSTIAEQTASENSATGDATKQGSAWRHQRNPCIPLRPQRPAPQPESTRHATEQPQRDEERTPSLEKREQYVPPAYHEERGSSSGHATEQPQITENLLREESPESQATNKGHATEQPQPEQPQPDTEDIPTLDKAEQELAYAIVNTFLDNPTLQSIDAEKIIKRVIVDEKQWTPEVLHSIDEVFRPVFVQYTYGTKDQTRWTSRDPAPYIREWRDTAKWRDLLQPGANAKGLQFSREEVAPIVHHITQEFIEKHATDEQRLDNFNKNKSRAEARLNRLCGSRHVANAIWQLGLPRVPSPATEQRSIGYSRSYLETATANVLEWLAKLAEVIQSHKATPEYQENNRKSGDSHGKSGLTSAELETRRYKKIEKWAKKW
jgi:hypothetical protein